jgi:hypothetical protein
MPRCVGTAVTRGFRQCKTSAPYCCLSCEAFLCSWHVVWAKDGSGAKCPWCDVPMKIRAYGTWDLEDPKTMRLTQVGRGMYRMFRQEPNENVDR